MNFKSPKGGTFQPTNTKAGQGPTFTPGANPGPTAPPDPANKTVNTNVLTSEADLDGIQKKGI